VREIRTEIEIGASPEEVWRVLTAFSQFGQWNPFIPRIDGGLAEGKTLRVRLAPPGGKAMTFRPTVLRAEAPREFRWVGHLLFPGVFDGEHIFELEDLGGRTRFVQREEFRGILAGPMLGVLRSSTERGFIAMNEALRRRVETAAC
jgi:hypothetical protein